MNLKSFSSASFVVVDYSQDNFLKGIIDLKNLFWNKPLFADKGKRIKQTIR